MFFLFIYLRNEIVTWTARKRRIKHTHTHTHTVSLTELKTVFIVYESKTLNN